MLHHAAMIGRLGALACLGALLLLPATGWAQEDTATPAQQESPAPAAPPAEPAGEPVATPERAVSRPDRIIARVGDFTISERDFQKDLVLRWSMQGPSARKMAPTEAFKRQVLRELIDARILRILARNSGITVTEEEVNTEYERGRRNMPSDEAFQAYLLKMDITLEELMAQIRERLVVEQYSERETAGMTISDEEVAEAYERLKAEGQTRREAPTADVGQILIIPEGADETAWEQAKAKIEAARQRIVDGEKFEDVAKDVSQDAMSAKRGGKYLEAVPGLVGPELSDKMMNLPIGELSAPFRSTVGWHIIEVYARYEPGEITLEQFAPVIRERLLNEKKTKELSRMIQDARTLIRVEILPQEN